MSTGRIKKAQATTCSLTGTGKEQNILCRSTQTPKPKFGENEKLEL
jgi:hypothetical protein